MPNRFLRALSLSSTTLILLAAGCETPWYAAEPAVDAAIPPTNPWTCPTSKDDLAKRVGTPADMHFFADQAEYMGDKDGNRYVHVREMSSFWGFLGECVYTIPDSQCPMDHPMPLTYDASRWQDVTWLGPDAPQGVQQNTALAQTPSFALGAPKTQPATLPAGGTMSGNLPASAPGEAPAASPESAPSVPPAPSTPAPAPAATSAPSTSAPAATSASSAATEPGVVVPAGPQSQGPAATSQPSGYQGVPGQVVPATLPAQFNK